MITISHLRDHLDRLGGGARRRWQALGRWVDERLGREEFARLDPVSQGFKPDAVAIEEAPVSLSANVALYTALTLLVVAILWSIFGYVDRIVVAPGKVATRTPMIVMQPFTTSRILQIGIKAGDHVRKGQVLVKFDPAFAQADVASLQQKVATLTVQTERLEAQLAGTPFAARAGDSVERLTQVQIFDQETSDYKAEVDQRDSRLRQIDSQIRMNEGILPGIRSQLEMANRMVTIQQSLRAQKAAAELDVMRAESGAIDSDLKLKNTLGEIAKLGGQRAETLQERRAYIDKWRSDHNQQLVRARQELAESAETLNKANRMRDFSEIVSPVDGTVLEVADRSVGSVLREAETLVTLVPDDAALYVEANVPSRDVSYVKVGDSVRIKLETYPFQRFGTINGILDVISADSIPQKRDDVESQLVYRVQVRIADPLSSIAERDMQIRPGLVASAEIKTGKRSIASYILHPILRTADESLREP
ncbi:MAG TPA: HlyD family type I secretion periplasmic adaptor subunit [Rhizomicrobium sp.]|nr:HlyD family type I secretion periplasmic adaptor subunit [Rhizomicrobium sp.]